MAEATLDAAIAGGLVVPKNTSYDAAPADVHASATADEGRPAAPETGAGEAGAEGGGGGGGGGTSVENDHTAPVVAPLAFFATTCQ